MLIITCEKRSNSQWDQESFKFTVSEKFVFIHILYMRAISSQQIVESRVGKHLARYLAQDLCQMQTFLLNMLFDVFSKSFFFDAEVSASSVGDSNYYSPPRVKNF